MSCSFNQEITKWDSLSRYKYQKAKLTFNENIKFFYQVKVSLESHWSLNYSKGVVTHRALLLLTLEEIKYELCKQSMIEVARIICTENGKEFLATLLVITFGIPTILDHIYAVYQQLFIENLVPKPWFWFNVRVIIVKNQRFAANVMWTVTIYQWMVEEWCQMSKLWLRSFCMLLQLH